VLILYNIKINMIIKMLIKINTANIDVLMFISHKS
jgi:hypothetical protein